MTFQIFYHRKDHGLVLIIFCKAQGLEIRQAAYVVDETLDIELHLQGTVPVLEGKHGTPIEPEVGVQDLTIKEIGDFLIIKVLIRSEEEAHNLQRTLVGDVKLAVSVGILATVDGCTAKGEVRVLLIQPVIFIEYTDAFRLNGRNRTEQIPHDLKMIIHFAATAHDIAKLRIFIAVTGTTRNGVLFKNVYMPARHLTITYQIAGCSQSSKTGTNDIGRFVLNTLRLSGTGKSLVVTTGIIHIQFLLVWYAVIIGRAVFTQN